MVKLNKDRIHLSSKLSYQRALLQHDQRNDLGANPAGEISKGLCCTNRVGDSLYESSVIAGGHEQLVPDEVPDKELAFIQCRVETTRIVVEMV